MLPMDTRAIILQYCNMAIIYPGIAILQYTCTYTCTQVLEHATGIPVLEDTGTRVRTRVRSMLLSTHTCTYLQYYNIIVIAIVEHGWIACYCNTGYQIPVPDTRY